MYILVINLGLKNVRSIIFDYQGREIKNVSLPLESFVSGVCVEQDASDWWEKTKQVVIKSLEESSIRNNVKYLTVTCSSSCLVTVDRGLTPLRRVIMVSDRRAIKEAKSLSIDASLMIPKIAWVNNNEPKRSGDIKYLSPNDFLIAKLTGRFITDSLNAEKFHWDARTRAYPQKILKELNLKEEQFPEVVDPGTNIGRLNPEVIKELGLNSEAEMIVTTYDAIGAVFGSGVMGEKDACDVSGTVTSLRTVVLQKNFTLKDSKLFAQPFALMGSDLTIVGGSNNQGGSLIEWLKQVFYQDASSPYDLLEKEAAASVPGARGLIFLPYLLGERAPIWNPDATGVFFGLQRFHNRHDMARAVLESTGFISKSILEELEQNNIVIDNIKLSGGLARIRLVSQLKADITGKVVYLPENFEASAYGVFILACVGAKIYPDLATAVNTLVRFKEKIIPNQENYLKYSETYQLFKKLYGALSDTFRERKEMMAKIYSTEDLSDKIKNL